MKELIRLILISPLFLGCASGTVKILDAPWVSMKNSNPPANPSQLVMAGNVNEEYCVDGFTSGSFGLMDEAVKQAEARVHLDYIKDASFTQSIGRSCVQVSGVGYRLK